MREFIEIECTICRRRNYTGMKDKRKKSGRLELKKFCPHCRKHTGHREVK